CVRCLRTSANRVAARPHAVSLVITKDSVNSALYSAAAGVARRPSTMRTTAKRAIGATSRWPGCYAGRWWGVKRTRPPPDRAPRVRAPALGQPLRSDTMQEHESEHRQQRRAGGRRRHAPLNTAWRGSRAVSPIEYHRGAAALRFLARFEELIEARQLARDDDQRVHLR